MHVRYCEQVLLISLKTCNQTPIAYLHKLRLQKFHISRINQIFDYINPKANKHVIVQLQMQVTSVLSGSNMLSTFSITNPSTYRVCIFAAIFGSAVCKNLPHAVFESFPFNRHFFFFFFSIYYLSRIYLCHLKLERIEIWYQDCCNVTECSA